MAFNAPIDIGKLKNFVSNINFNYFFCKLEKLFVIVLHLFVQKSLLSSENY